MLLNDKYSPKKYTDVDYNKNQLSFLMNITNKIDIPHIIISGPEGVNKNAILKIFLENLYGSEVNNTKWVSYEIKGSTAKKKIEVEQSDYHIIIEPNGTNHDKYNLQCIIKKYTSFKPIDIFLEKRKFRTIVINNIDILAVNSQESLRRTMEIYAHSYRFIMISNNLSKVFPPINSRCCLFCLSLPNPDQCFHIAMKICFEENISLTALEIKKIIQRCHCNINEIIWTLEAIKTNKNSNIFIDIEYDHIVEIILSSVKATNFHAIFSNIKTILYKLFTGNIKGHTIIQNILNRMIDKVNNDLLCTRFIAYASDAETNLVMGRRHISHIEYFISGIIYELMKQ